MYAKGT
jgi:hypothetical protein